MAAVADLSEKQTSKGMTERSTDDNRLFLNYYYNYNEIDYRYVRNTGGQLHTTARFLPRHVNPLRGCHGSQANIAGQRSTIIQLSLFLFIAHEKTEKCRSLRLEGGLELT